MTIYLKDKILQTEVVIDNVIRLHVENSRMSITYYDLINGEVTKTVSLKEYYVAFWEL